MNQTITQDADAKIVRANVEEIDIVEGLKSGHKIINKLGRNPDVGTGSLPEDVWNGSTKYT